MIIIRHRKTQEKLFESKTAKNQKEAVMQALYNEIDLCNANLGNANLGNADLRNANLGNANLYNANLCYADLRKANLRNANLYNADLCNANLRKADLGNADLCNADLRNANLGNANLYNANLCYADLRNANLYNADLCNANLCKANLGVPTNMLLAYWRSLSKETTKKLMRLDASSHPKPELFEKWAQGGECPYMNSKFLRVVNFKEDRDLYEAGPPPTIYEALKMILDEKCPGWDE